MLLKILEPITVFSENENRHFKVNVEINKIFRSFVSSFMCTEKRKKRKNRNFCSLQRCRKPYKVNTGRVLCLDIILLEEIIFFVSFMLLLMKADVFGALICCLLAFNDKTVVCYPIQGSSKEQS